MLVSTRLSGASLLPGHSLRHGTNPSPPWLMSPAGGERLVLASSTPTFTLTTLRPKSRVPPSWATVRNTSSGPVTTTLARRVTHRGLSFAVESLDRPWRRPRRQSPPRLAITGASSSRCAGRPPQYAGNPCAAFDANHRQTSGCIKCGTGPVGSHRINRPHNQTS